MNANKSKGGTRYDGELQMFCDTAREPNRAALQFIRWMVEQGRLEHDAAGPPTGEYAAEPLSEASIQLTATSNDNDAAGGFNSARKTYTIVLPR